MKKKKEVDFFFLFYPPLLYLLLSPHERGTTRVLFQFESRNHAIALFKHHRSSVYTCRAVDGGSCIVGKDKVSKKGQLQK